jgi:hypothetical protein
LAKFYDQSYDTATVTANKVSGKTAILHNENDPVLGGLKGRFRVKLGIWYFLPHLVLLLLSLTGFAIFWGSNAGWQRYVSLGVFLLFTAPLVFAIWKTIPRLRDKLSVYDNGFTYRRGRRVFFCPWDEIKDVSEILDLDDRLKITSVTKSNGERIEFAYKMRGLDVLSYEYHLFQNKDDLDDGVESDSVAPIYSLGNRIETFRSKHGWGTFLPLGAVLFVAAFGSLAAVASKDVFSVAVCAGPPILLFLGLLWTVVHDWNDELTVYENGFSYATSKGIVNCAWEEIEDYSQARRSADLTGVKKSDGTWIRFAGDMQGLELIQPHIRKVIKWTAPED